MFFVPLQRNGRIIKSPTLIVNTSNAISMKPDQSSEVIAVHPDGSQGIEDLSLLQEATSKRSISHPASSTIALSAYLETHNEFVLGICAAIFFFICVTVVFLLIHLYRRRSSEKCFVPLDSVSVDKR